MDGMKYVVVETNLCEMLFIFPTNIDHGQYCSDNRIKKDKIISAGFVKSNLLNRIFCTGRSVSLDTVSRGNEDTYLVRRMLGWEPEDLKDL